MTTPRIARKRIERLLRALYDASAELTELAESERLTLSQLAEWSNDDLTIAALDGLCRLNDARAQLLVSRYRTLAAARLFELAKDDAGGEVARKACVDLLGVRLTGDLNGDDGAGTKEQDDSAPPSTESLRMLLADIGRNAAPSDPTMSRSSSAKDESGA